MARTDRYIREEENVLRKENRETHYTIRLHFAKENKDDEIIEEIQKLLTETYIRSVTDKGGSHDGSDR